MKKLVVIIFILCSYTVHSQNPDDPVYKVAKKYFRSHPIGIKFSSFILSVQKDPWFTISEFYRRTDSTQFFLSGTYRNFNPFQFVPKGIEFHIAEEEIRHTDSLKTLDTIINLQLIAIADSGATGIKAVQKEFKRFNSSQSKYFSSSTYKFFPNKGPIVTETYNYFVYPFSIAPTTISWGLLPDGNQYAFVITLRFKLKQNMADYILTPEELESL